MRRLLWIWLSSLLYHTTGRYAKLLSEYGFENVGLLSRAEEHDLAECFDRLGVKKPHRRLIQRNLPKTAHVELR